MNPLGFTSAMHLKRFFFPIPGSISTGTAPALKRAKVTAMKSKPGLTSRMILSPFFIPSFRRPFAYLFDSFSSCENV